MQPAQQTHYYTTHAYLQRRFQNLNRKLAFRAEDRESWEAWHTATVQKLRELIGYETMEQCSANPEITRTEDLGDYIRQHIVIQTEPGVEMPMFVLIPRVGTAPYPVVIAPHGHASNGKSAVAGLRDLPEVRETIEVYNYDYGVQLVRAGFIVFCPDARGFGERLEEFDREHALNSSCRTLNNIAYPLGQTVTGMWTWDLHRLIDYIETREDCRTDRIGCAGLSGGGLQTLWAAALDMRIRCAVISGYLYGYKEALIDLPLNCSCNYIPHLYEYVDMGDIAALIAPRPLLIETGDQDDLNGASGLDNVRPQVATIQKAYDLLGKSDRVKHDVFAGGHRWNGIEAIAWLQRFLR